ncbi:unnamed protein product, partial [Rhizoctonia solani]
EIDGPFDEEDSRMVVRGYIKKMTRPDAEFPSPKTPIQLMRVPYEAMKHMRVYDLAAECIQATLPYAWIDIAALNEQYTYNAKDAKNTVDNMHMHVCRLVTKIKEILEVNAGDITPEQISEFLYALANGDFLAIIGRALLAFATYFAARVNVDSEIDSVATLLKKRYSPEGVSQIFGPSLSDIHKATRQNELVYALSQQATHVYKFARDSKVVLEGLMAGLGITLEENPTSDALPCAYGRCSATHVDCVKLKIGEIITQFRTVQHAEFSHK